MDMDLTMSVAAMSMSMKSSQLQQAVDISLLKKAMNTEQELAAQTLESLQSMPAPGRLLDVTV